MTTREEKMSMFRFTVTVLLFVGYFYQASSKETQEFGTECDHKKKKTRIKHVFV